MARHSSSGTSAIVEGMILALGVVAIAVGLYTTQITSTVYETNGPADRLAERVAHHIGLSHVWLEEAIAGDASVDLEQDVFDNLDQALVLIEAGLEGGRTSFGTIERVVDPAARAEFEELRAETLDYRASTERRVSEQTEAGSEAEHAYDRSFFLLMDSAEEADQAVSHVIAAEQRNLGKVKTLAGLGLLMLFSGMAAIARRHRKVIARKNDDLARMREIELSHRHASELNDEVYQGLAITKYALEAGNVEMARASLNSTLGSAGSLMSRLMTRRDLAPGDLVRERPALVLRDEVDFEAEYPPAP